MCTVQMLRRKTLPAVFADIQKLTNSYEQLARDERTDVAGTLQQTVSQVNERHSAVQSSTDDAEQILSGILQKKMNFDSNHETTLTWLHVIDKELKTIEAALSSSSSASQQQQHCLILKVY